MVEFATREVNPIIQALPPMIVARSEDQSTSAELHALARLMLVEYEAGVAGRQGVLDRFAEVMFVLVLRHYMQHAPELKGFLAALKDERIVRALGALHRVQIGGWRRSRARRAYREPYSRNVLRNYSARHRCNTLQSGACTLPRRCFEHGARRWRRSPSGSGIKPRLPFAGRSDACAVSRRVMCGGEHRRVKLNVDVESSTDGRGLVPSRTAPILLTEG